LSVKETPSKRTLNRLRNAVISWFDDNGRDYPWREDTTPYRILIAEMLLRRTTATAVLRVYSPFLATFSSIEELARADQAEIQRTVKGLGLQRVRANHLSRTSKTIQNDHGGEVPNDLDVLLKLPGLGRYSAAAILNFAFGQSVSMVDGNIAHLVSRVLDFESASPDDESIWRLVDNIGQPDHDRRLYWGMIDLVALVCLRSNPRCQLCPLNNLCEYYRKAT
jgi:A/G-specific adenine glycosylase